MSFLTLYLRKKGDYKQLSYYWFPQRGRILTNAYQLKIFALLGCLDQAADRWSARTPCHPGLLLGKRS